MPMQPGDNEGKGRADRPGSGEVSANPKPGSRLWPTLIILGLTLVILVNLAFIYVAVSGADEVVPSYETEER